MPAFASTLTITDVTPISGTAPLLVTISFDIAVEGDGEVTSIDWDFGDLSTVTVNYPVPPGSFSGTINHTYTSAGSFIVQGLANWENLTSGYDYWSVRFQGEFPYPPDDILFPTDTLPFIIPVEVTSGPITYKGGRFSNVIMRTLRIGGTL